MEKKYVAYYRVSSKEQGESGLGLEAQQRTVTNHIKTNGNKIIEEFTEVESGSRNTTKKRPELEKAIALTIREEATLVIARLDRLSRNVHFLTTLMESKVKFECCDLPEADHFTIHLFAVFAQKYVDDISRNTKAALDAKKRREPDWHQGAKKGQDNIKDNGRAKAMATRNYKSSLDHPKMQDAWDFIYPRRSGFGEQAPMSFRAIAKELNNRGKTTVDGGIWYASTVKAVWDRFKPEDYDQ